MDYPPEPWDLRGHGYVSLWQVPVSALPPLPPEVKPLSLLGRALVSTAFVDYLPGGLLPYHELLAGVLVRQGRQVGLTITDIWVDSPSSRAGGRELWGIPKELADFKLVHEPTFTGTATENDTVLADAHVRKLFGGVKLPVPVQGTVLQTLNGALARTPVRANARIHLARSTWQVGGALSWLSGRRPFATITATDFDLRFGPRRA
ncbi:acetoacetate decarboxylase family protein [Amycolatopsis acididurans]|uniref:acetoacetate decarboxylase family protein n=1 Tax=Amycolatopsis acididurans TaxID=2724524 RepID=UPI0028A6CB6D|nr:acetoacetate decarboxylase family protein [Amycolatopsis acididurans]